MVQRNQQIRGSNDADKFDKLLGLLIEKYQSTLYYHEIIGILQMQATGLILEAYGLTDEEDEDEDDWSSLIGSPDDED
jgi:hypothetical protein